MKEQELRDYFNDKNWYDFYQKGNIENMTEILITKIKDDISHATTQFSVNPKLEKIHPWITLGIIKSVDTKQKLYIEYLRDPQNKQKMRNYKNYKSHLDKLVFKTKTD